MFPMTFLKPRTLSKSNRKKKLSSNQIYFSILVMAKVTWVSWQNDASFWIRTSNICSLTANMSHVWNVCIKWSYLFRISRFIARKVAWASDDLLILNFFWFLRRHEFRICIFELRFFQKFCSREHSKRLLGRWRKIENSKIHFLATNII